MIDEASSSSPVSLVLLRGPSLAYILTFARPVDALLHAFERSRGQQV